MCLLASCPEPGDTSASLNTNFNGARPLRIRAVSVQPCGVLLGQVDVADVLGRDDRLARVRGVAAHGRKSSTYVLQLTHDVSKIALVTTSSHLRSLLANSSSPNLSEPRMGIPRCAWRCNVDTCMLRSRACTSRSVGRLRRNAYLHPSHRPFQLNMGRAVVHRPEQVEIALSRSDDIRAKERTAAPAFGSAA